MPLSPSILDWVRVQIGAVVEAHQLPGSTSTTLYRITTPDNRAYVLRLYDNADWLTMEPDLCEHEASALQAIYGAGITTPELIAHEPDASVAGVPLLLMSQLAGEIQLQPDNMEDWLAQSAKALAAIHRAPVANFDWAFYRYARVERLSVPAWSAEPEKWQHIINILRSPEPDTPPVFIHRDYHMTNFLWLDGRLSGVVDWINACIGPAGMDVGHMRLNLALLYGIDIADRFLEAYQRANPAFSAALYWDLVALGDGTLYDDTPPGVYPPWVDFGMTGLSDALMLVRTEAYASHLVTQFIQ